MSQATSQPEISRSASTQFPTFGEAFNALGWTLIERMQFLERNETYADALQSLNKALAEAGIPGRAL